MLARAAGGLSGALLVMGLSGCPVTDDYFIEAAGVAAGGGDTSGGGSAMDPGRGGQSAAGQGGSQSLQGGREATAGAPAAGSLAASCMSATERCNGHDDDCDDVVDEQACNSKDNGTTGCAGFVIAGHPQHGYMLCRTTLKDYGEAKLACQQQNMHLAWLETGSENQDVTAKVKALTTDETWIGASDATAEGEWRWDGPGGERFWSGDESGMTVNGAFAAWMMGTPNDDNGGEDCAVLQTMTGSWGDRSCSTRYAYLCEEPGP